MNYPHIVFDVDGTLLDTESAVLHSLQDAVPRLIGRQMPLEDLRFSIGLTGHETLRRLGLPEQDFDRGMQIWNEELVKWDHAVKVYDGMLPLLDALTRSGHRLGVVTSRAGEKFRSYLEGFGLKGYFPTIIQAEDTPEHKPHPAPLNKYLERTGAARTDVLYIGDSIHDLGCATAAQIDFALAGWGSTLQDPRITCRLQTPLQLLDVLGEAAPAR